MSLKLQRIFYVCSLLYSVACYPINENVDRLDTTFVENDIAVLTSEHYQTVNNNDENVLGAAWNMAKKWPGKTIPYIISFYGHSKQYKLKQAMAEIERNTCIRFVRKKSNDHSYINFIQDSNDACYSFPGKQGGSQRLSLPDWCLDNHDSILHELMHALGFLHEQNRHDRDEHITINWFMVNSLGGNSESVDWKKRDRSELRYFNTNYDYTSVMHYPATIRGITLITPKRFGAHIGSNGLSRNDVQRINRLYECSNFEAERDNDDHRGEYDDNDRENENDDENDGRRDGRHEGDDQRDNDYGRRDNRREPTGRKNKGRNRNGSNGDQQDGDSGRDYRGNGNDWRRGGGNRNKVDIKGNRNRVVISTRNDAGGMEDGRESDFSSNDGQGNHVSEEAGFERQLGESTNLCQNGVYYCGSQLSQMNYTMTTSSDLYFCDNGKAVFEETCAFGCLTLSRSRCV